MGNANSGILQVCHTLKKKKENVQENGDDDSIITDSAIIQRNKDKYFSKEDYDRILEKYPLFKEWIDESANAQTKDRPKQKKIRFREAEVIGLGSYGRVIMGLNAENGCLMATKQVQLGTGNHPAQEEKVKSLQMEIDLLSRFSHKNIVRYYGAQKNKNTFNIFLEYVSGGSIASLLDKYGPFNENLIRVYIRQILEGLEYLHVRNTIHRDIKGANILVDNNGVCKLADFGTATKISRLVEGDSKDIASIKGTARWMAPEVIKQNSLGRFCDIWSVGCTVIEMATAKPPWYSVVKTNSNSISTLYQIAQAKSSPPLPKGLSAEAIDFLKQCFKTNPQERPNVIKLLQHKFVSGLESPYHSFDYPSRDSQNSQPGNAKFTMRIAQTKNIAPNNSNQNQVSKALNRQLSTPNTLKANREIPVKDKKLELENDIKIFKGNRESGKMPDICMEKDHENKSQANNAENTAPTALHHVSRPLKSKSLKRSSINKYLMHGEHNDDLNEKGDNLFEARGEDNPKNENIDQMNCNLEEKNLVDLRRNKKVNILPKQLEHNHYGLEYPDSKGEQLSEINCFVEGEKNDDDDIKSRDEGVYTTNCSLKHASKISYENRIPAKLSISNEYHNSHAEEHNEKFEEKKDLKRSYENKKAPQFRINIEKQDDQSYSQDSDRDPSVINSSFSKPFGNINATHHSFSVHNFEGRNMRTHLHDQSSRLSFIRETSFDTRDDQIHFENNSQFQDQRIRKPRTRFEILKLDNSLARKNNEKQSALNNSTSNKKEELSNTRKSNWSLPDNQKSNEEKQRFKKIQEEEQNAKEIASNEYLQNFNLLDDLNKVYGQLDAINPPINS